MSLSDQVKINAFTAWSNLTPQQSAIVALYYNNKNTLVHKKQRQSGATYCNMVASIIKALSTNSSTTIIFNDHLNIDDLIKLIVKYNNDMMDKLIMFNDIVDFPYCRSEDFIITYKRNSNNQTILFDNGSRIILRKRVDLTHTRGICNSNVIIDTHKPFALEEVIKYIPLVNVLWFDPTQQANINHVPSFTEIKLSIISGELTHG